MTIPFPSTHTNTMKLPNVCSIPALTDIDPFAPFEFHFPSDDMWWDLSDLSSSEPEDDHLDSDLDLSFTSSFYQFSPDPEFTDEDELIDEENNEKEDVNNDNEGDAKNEKDDINFNFTSSEADCVPSDRFIDQIVRAISHTCPASKYKRRKFASKRRRKRRQRKLATTENIEPELKALWININTVGDLFAPSAVSKNPPPCSLPKVNLANVNKQMLRRLPDVVQIPVHSCSNDPAFYERNLPSSYDSLTSAFGKTNPFGALPAIMTNVGPVPPPTDACYGYMWTDDGWRVKAERPPVHVPDPGGGHRRRGEVGGGHVGGAERRGWRNKNLCER